MKYYVVYKTVNLVNGKVYIGCHKTNDINDGYLGSGKLLKRAIKKYGEHAFNKEILEVFDNPEDMFEMESKLVGEDIVKNNDFYNLKLGGSGGFDYINSTGKNLYENNTKHLKQFQNENIVKMHRTLSERLKNDPEYRENYINRIKQWQKLNGNPFKGKTHTEQTKSVIGMKNSEHQRGSKNSQFGTIWITDGYVNKKISNREDIPDGWKRGRTLKCSL